MDDKLKYAFMLIGIGIVVGVIVAWVLFSVLGAKPTGVDVGPVKFEFSADQATPTVASVQQVTQQPSELNCSFIDELVTKGDVIQTLDVPRGSGFYAGVQIRLISSVEVPAGWVVHRDSKEYQGPIRLEGGTVASIWSPESCRPLNVLNQPTPLSPTPTTPPVTTGRSCIAKEQGPLAQTNHTFSGPVHVVQLWRQNGQSPWGTSEVMAVVVGDVTIIEAGGNVWTYPSAECEAVAKIHMLDGAKTRGSIVVTEEESREAGLIK